MRIWFRETEQALGRRAPLNMDFDTMRAKTGEQEGIICTDERMYIRLRYEYGDRLELQVIDGETYPFERLDNGYWMLSLADFHEFCYVYTPPGYVDENEKYPILYLQHGYGENELGWLYQG